MCDYSLDMVASRPARAGDRLVSTAFRAALTRGFAAIGEPAVAVCLLPGTEVAFDKNVESYGPFHFFRMRKLKQRVARFRQINLDQPNVHHNVLEFPDGQITLLSDLVGGQFATVLQLPASTRMPTKKMQTEQTLAETAE
jgi:hypothetical protein